MHGNVVNKENLQELVSIVGLNQLFHFIEIKN